MKNMRYQMRVNSEKKKKTVSLFPIPECGATIIINEKAYIQNPGRNSGALYRGCVLVQGETEHLIICKEQRTPDYQCTVTFKKVDFVKGVLRYKTVKEPKYTFETPWRQFALELII